MGRLVRVVGLIMKLTNDMRLSIRKEVVQKTFATRMAALKETEESLAVAVRDEGLTAEQKKAVDSLPSNFFKSHARYFYVRRGDDNASTVQIDFPDGVNFPQLFCGVTRVLEPGKLADDILAFKHHRDGVHDAKGLFEGQLTGTLEAFKTVEKLLASWPTLKEVMPEGFFDEKPKPQLPATTVNLLDEALKAAMKEAA